MHIEPASENDRIMNRPIAILLGILLFMIHFMVKEQYQLIVTLLIVVYALTNHLQKILTNRQIINYKQCFQEAFAYLFTATFTKFVLDFFNLIFFKAGRPPSGLDSSDVLLMMSFIYYHHSYSYYG